MIGVVVSKFSLVLPYIVFTICSLALVFVIGVWIYEKFFWLKKKAKMAMSKEETIAKIEELLESLKNANGQKKG